MNILETHRITPIVVDGCDVTVQYHFPDGTHKDLTTFHMVKGGHYDTILLISNDENDEISTLFESGGLGVLLVKEAS